MNRITPNSYHSDDNSKLRPDELIVSIRRIMPEKFKVVISGLSGRFPECGDVDTFKERLYKNDNLVTVDDRKWPVGFKHKRKKYNIGLYQQRIFLNLLLNKFVYHVIGLGEKLIPDATGKFHDLHEYDHTVFRMNQTFAFSNDLVNRRVLEPAFEAIIDAGKT